jgi:hypothetical protein
MKVARLVGKVAMLVGMLVLNLIAGYESGRALDASMGARLSDGGDAHARDEFPPPTWP